MTGEATPKGVGVGLLRGEPGDLTAGVAVTAGLTVTAGVETGPAGNGLGLALTAGLGVLAPH